MSPDLSLTVQYAVAAPELPRWRVRRWVARALEHALIYPHPHAGRPVQITLRIVDAAESQRLNKQFRKRDSATNVLTFVYGISDEGQLQADIVLCLAVLQQEAIEQNKPLRHHAAHLVTHGVLHALGFDHDNEAQAEVMERLEAVILAAQRIPDPYQGQAQRKS